MEKLELEFDTKYKGYEKDLRNLRLTNLMSVLGVGLVFLCVGIYFAIFMKGVGVFQKVCGYAMMIVSVFFIVVVPIFSMNSNIHKGITDKVKLTFEGYEKYWTVTYYVKIKKSEVLGKFTERINKVVFSKCFIEIFHNGKITYVPLAVLSGDQKSVFYKIQNVSN